MNGALRCATCGTDEPRRESRFCRVCGAPFPPSPAPRVAKTVPDEAPLVSSRGAPAVRRVAPTRVDPTPPSRPSGPEPYRLSPVPYGRPGPPAPAYASPAPAHDHTPGLTPGGLAVRAIVAIALSVGALFAADRLYEEIKKPAAAWVGETFSQDRPTSRAIVGGGLAVTVTLAVTLTVLLVSTRRRS
ncbi:MAG: hypothetical protein U0414_30200 [Polyangiaceae bacterium]